MIGVSVGNRKEKEKEKENPLGQNSDFQKFTTFSKNGIMQRFIRLRIGLGEIYAYTKFEPGGRKRKHTIGVRKSALGRFGAVVYIVQLRFAVFFFVWGGDRCRGRTIFERNFSSRI